MQSNSLRWVFPFVALAIGVVGFMGINAIAQEDQSKTAVDTRPTVQVETVEANKTIRKYAVGGAGVGRSN